MSSSRGRPATANQDIGARTFFSDPSISKRIAQGALVGMLFATAGILIGAATEENLCRDDPFCGLTDAFVFGSLGFNIGSTLGVYPSGQNGVTASLPAMFAASSATYLLCWGVSELTGGILAPLVLVMPPLAALVVFNATLRTKSSDSANSLIGFDGCRLHLSVPAAQIRVVHGNHARVTAVLSVMSVHF